MSKIQVGYGSDWRRDSTAKNLYGKKRSGKVKQNGGFGGEPTVTYTRIPQDVWDSIFGKKDDDGKV